MSEHALNFKNFEGNNYRKWLSSYDELAGRSEWDENKKIKQVIWYVDEKFREKVKKIPQYLPVDAEDIVAKAARQETFWLTLAMILEKRTKTVKDLYVIEIVKDEEGET